MYEEEEEEDNKEDERKEERERKSWEGRVGSFGFLLLFSMAYKRSLGWIDACTLV